MQLSSRVAFRQVSAARPAARKAVSRGTVKVFAKKNEVIRRPRQGGQDPAQPQDTIFKISRSLSWPAHTRG